MLTKNQAYEKLTEAGWELSEGSTLSWVHPEIEGWIQQRDDTGEVFTFYSTKFGYRGQSMTAWFYSIENILNYAKSI